MFSRKKLILIPFLLLSFKIALAANIIVMKNSTEEINFGYLRG